MAHVGHAGSRRGARSIASGLVLGAVVGSLSAAGAVIAGAPAASAGDRVCPARNFVIGAGWGADRGSRGHRGIDLGGERGSPILAIEDGVIDRTKRQDNGALQIVLQGESGSKFYYGHMDDVLIRGGQRVRAGDLIGTMGDSGSPGAVHLHFEFWRSGGESDAIDPAELIDRVCGRGGDRSGASVREPAPDRGQRPSARKPGAAITGETFSN